MQLALLVVLATTTNTCGRSDSLRQDDPEVHRRVSWFTRAIGVLPSVSGLNNTEWARAHRRSLTGYTACCGFWDVGDNGTFTLSRQTDAFVDEISMGLDVVASGRISPAALLSHAWQAHRAVDAAVAAVQRTGWRGLAIDNEQYRGQPHYDARLPAAYADFLGNLSVALHSIGAVLYVDSESTWGSCVCGGQANLVEYSRRAPNAVFMDMSTYFGPRAGFANGHTVPRTLAQVEGWVHALASWIPVRQIAVGIGLTSGAAHRNASCGAWPQCTDFNSTKCGCYDYGWDAASLVGFADAIAAVGVAEIQVWRNDITPPKGTLASVPPFFTDAMAHFLHPGARSTQSHPSTNVRGVAAGQ